MVAVSAFRGALGSLLDAGYDSSALRALQAIERVTDDPSGRLQIALAALENEAARLDAADEKMDLSNPVLRLFISDAEAASAANRRTLADAGLRILEQAASDSRQGTLQEALIGVSSDQLIGSITAEWNSVDPEAVSRLIGYVDSPGWAAQLNEYEGALPNAIRENVVAGFIRGDPVARTVSTIRKSVQDVPRHVANTMTRTVYMQSYRTGTAIQQSANTNIINRVIRFETLDRRICPACIALHGSIVWDRERDGGNPVTRIAEHHNGRGVARTEVRGATRRFQAGEEWFNSLPDDRQRRLFNNNAAYAAYKDGAITLQDMVTRYHDPVFTVNDQYTDRAYGDLVRQSSLVGILGDDARRYYGRQ